MPSGNTINDLLEDNAMNEFERQRQTAERMKQTYPPGTRIQLDHMEDPWAPVPPGTRGTVQYVDDIGQIGMKWDNGRSLSLVPGEDSFRKLNAWSVRVQDNDGKTILLITDKMCF